MTHSVHQMFEVEKMQAVLQWGLIFLLALLCSAIAGWLESIGINLTNKTWENEQTISQTVTLFIESISLFATTGVVYSLSVLFMKMAGINLAPLQFLFWIAVASFFAMKDANLLRDPVVVILFLIAVGSLAAIQVHVMNQSS